MGAESKRPKDWDCALLALDEAIQALDLADKGSGNPPAKAVFSCVSGLLATIKVRFLLFSGDFLLVHT